MKNVIRPAQKEEVEIICDGCEAVIDFASATIKFEFGYGSGLDLNHGALHFCSKCSNIPEQLAKNWEKKFKTFKLEEYTF